VTQIEFEDRIHRLEVAFGKEGITDEKLNLMYEEFKDVGSEVFAKAAQRCIKTLQYFPSIASIWKALRDVGWKAKANWKPVRPRVFYKDQAGYTYALANEEGRCASPPERIERDDGRVLTKVFRETEE